MTPACSSARTRRRHGDGESRTCSASSTLVSRPSAWSWRRIARSMTSIGRSCRKRAPIEQLSKEIARVHNYSRVMRTSAEVTSSRTLSGAAGIGIAVGVYGVSFGVLAVAAGLSPAQACVMSMLVFTGASQFAFVGVLAAGGGALAAMGPAVMLALRNAAYGLSLAPILPRRLRERAFLAQFVIDESTAMARAQDDPVT